MTPPRHQMLQDETTRTILDASFDAAFMVRSNGEIMYLNTAARCLFYIDGDISQRPSHQPLHISTYITIVDNDCSLPWPEFLTRIRQHNHSPYSSSSAAAANNNNNDDDGNTNHNDPGVTRRKTFGWRTNGVLFSAQLQAVALPRHVTDDQDDERIILYVRSTKDLTAKDAANQLRGIIETSMDPIISLNSARKILLVNDAAVEQFGYSKQELMGNSMDMIIDNLPLLEGRHRLSALRKDQTQFPVEIGLSEITSMDHDDKIYYGFFRDLSKQAIQEEELKRRTSFTDKIIEASYTALVVTNRRGEILRVNDAAVSKFMWTRDEFRTKQISDIFSPKYANNLRRDMDAYLDVGVAFPKHQEVEGCVKCGTTFPASMAVAPLEENDYFAIYVQDLTIQKKMNQFHVEKIAAEMLLVNMLPAPIADVLKDNPTHVAQHHDCATILFADIVGFTKMSSEMEPEEIVAMLNELFSLFDNLVDRYDLNKIKTIGDCYMVSSVPTVRHSEGDIHRVCFFALEMLTAIEEYNKAHSRKLDLRIGINCGPVVAGVVGATRFLYDLWGDAVNVASRMESTGMAGKIHVTTAVEEAVRDAFLLENRGTVSLKGKGEVTSFFLVGATRQPNLSIRKASKRLYRGRRYSMEMRYDSVGSLIQDLATKEKVLEDQMVQEAAKTA